MRSLRLIYEFTRLFVKLRYKNTVLGYAWSLVTPLGFASVFYFAFKVVIDIRVPNYALFLVTGLFAWIWMARSIEASSLALIQSASIIKKVNFNKGALVVAGVVSEFYHFLIAVVVIALFHVLHGSPVPVLSWIWAIPLMSVMQISALVGIGLVVASTNVFFRDISKIVEILMQMLFYATPIIYSQDMYPKGCEFLVYLNPFSAAVINWRNVLLEGRLDVGLYVYGCFLGAILLLVGIAVFSRLKHRFAEAL